MINTSQELLQLLAHLPECRACLDGPGGLGSQGIPQSPCVLGAPQVRWPLSCLEGLVFPVHLVGLCLLEFPDHPVKEKMNNKERSLLKPIAVIKSKVLNLYSHLLAVATWISELNSLCPSFLSHKVRILIVSTN